MNMKVIEFCAREVEYQHRGPLQVWWMLEAWEYLQKWSWDEQFLLLTIQRLGHKVERIKNSEEQWRGINVRVGTSIKPHYQHVPGLMDGWLKDYGDMTPEEAYHAFEEVHPFIDGNGRVGKIIFNWLNGSLDNPVFPSSYGEDKWQKENGFRPG